MKRDPTGIATTYKGVTFRSRLEARWAILFDSFGWPWAYEPIDLDGYIPDFILKFHKPLLVEVKPAMTLPELRISLPKPASSGWKGEILLLGATLFGESEWFPTIGILQEVHDDPGSERWDGVGEGKLFHCRNCKRISIHHGTFTYSCRVNGCYEGDHFLGELPWSTVNATWVEAGNTVQWMPGKRSAAAAVARRARPRPPAQGPDIASIPADPETIAWAKATLEKLLDSPVTNASHPARNNTTERLK